MSLNNILTDYPFTFKWYLRRPWKFFQHTWYNLKGAWQRATRGYAYSDAAEMDEFLLHILPGMLRKVGDGFSFPGVEPFETVEKWEDWCNSLADVFESLQEENWETGRNEYEEDFHKALEVTSPHKNVTLSYEMTEEEAKNICKLYWAREKELWDQREAILQDAYKQLALYHTYLWI